MPRPQPVNHVLDASGSGEFYAVGGMPTSNNDNMSLGEYRSPFERNARDPDDPGFAKGLVTSPKQEQLLTAHEQKRRRERELHAAAQWGFILDRSTWFAVFRSGVTSQSSEVVSSTQS